MEKCLGTSFQKFLLYFIPKWKKKTKRTQSLPCSKLTEVNAAGERPAEGAVALCFLIIHLIFFFPMSSAKHHK